MVIDFSVGNFRSFKDVQTLSFRATGLSSPDPATDVKNIIQAGENNRILKIIGIYGANASGKSNLVKALAFFKLLVARSVESENILGLFMKPFRLTASTPEHNGYFQIILLIDGKKYRYGFTLGAEYNIQNEWLFGTAEKNETYYFKRNGSKVLINNEYFSEGDNLPKDKLRRDALFLTFCSSYDGSVSKSIRDFISNQIILESDPQEFSRGMVGPFYRNKTNALIRDGNKAVVLDYLRRAGLSYSDVNLERIDLHNSKIVYDLVKLEKAIYDKDLNVVGKAEMELDDDESQGTQKFYSYIGNLYQLFRDGGIYVSDEIDSNFHPSLLTYLIKLFQNSEFNLKSSQLLFTSYDTNLMNPDCMRRDQFYFTEKTSYEDTRLYSLADLKGIRNNADFAKQYLAGYYGALPILGNYLQVPQE
jgi:AAA15 family ATPase/GTPase